MSEFRLPRLPRSVQIAAKDGTPTLEFQRWWQSMAQMIETQENAQDTLLAAIIAAQEAAAAAQEAAATANAAVEEVNTAVAEINETVETVNATLDTVNTEIASLNTRVDALEP